MGGYRIDQRNKVKRVPERGHYDKSTVFEILDAGKICHASFVVDNQPFVIPTIYGRDGDCLYLHGATTSRLIKQLETGVQISLAVTHLDGLVLARSAFHHSMNYRSVVIFGTAKLVMEDNKMQALKVISDQLVPGRWEESRQPNAKELKATAVLEIKIDQASAKIRTGGPKDDKEDYDLDIWAGVVPMQTTYQAIIPDIELKNGIAIPKSVINLIN
ncbi:pyridoxamine 5'-phosphate oxidase family protein [Fulvivirga sp.]|uniref:pyridoxamine 5'-phosphate oxidase family protein n=1 Tax=Fulvivirga sp. TaxID=1931237 RepID=UPI0032EBBD6A